MATFQYRSPFAEEPTTEDKTTFQYKSPFREPTEEEQLVAQTPEKTVFDEIERATPSMTGALIGGAVGAPLGPIGVLGGAALGGAIGEYGRMAYEWITGSEDLPGSAIEQAKRATVAGLEGAGGEGAGAIISKGAKVALPVLNKVRNNNLATKALETAKKKVIQKAPPVVKEVLKYGESLEATKVKGIYTKAGEQIAEGATSALSPTQRGELFLDTLKGGKALQNTAVKDALLEIDKSISGAARGSGPTRGGFLESPLRTHPVGVGPIRQDVSNKLKPFTEGLASPEVKEIAGRVTSYVDNLGPRATFEQAHAIRMEIQTAIDMAEDVGNTRLATALRRSRNKVSEIMDTTAEAAGKGREFRAATKPWVEGVDEIDNSFLRTLMKKDPKSVGAYLFSEGTPQQIKKAKNLLGAKAEPIIRDMQEGYFKSIFDKAIDPDTGLFSIDALTNIMKNPKQVKNLRAAFGDKYETVETFVKAIEKQQDNPGAYLVQGTGVITLISGLVDPTIGGAALAAPLIRRGIVGTGNISAEVLSRLASNPEHLKILNLTLRTPASAPQAARLLGQLKTTIGDIVQDISEEEGRVEERGFEYRSPFEQAQTEQVQPTTSPPAETATQNKEEDWIQKYQQVNPGVSRQEAIEEGKRLGKVPKNYEQSSGKDQGSSKSPSRGIRNNNPGNIEKSDINWQGKIKGSDKRFETFKTPEDGIRAMTVNLRTYFNKYGLNTVSDIISRWAPVSDNNPTSRYIQTVARRMGVKPNEKLDLNDPKIMKKLVEAIIQVENGKMPYEEATLSKGVKSAYT